jgi:hypothetical protein
MEEEMEERSKQLGRDLVTPIGAREGDDVERRMRHLDRLGIDVQVMIHTLWTVPVTDHPEVELALCKSWNRWVAEMWRLGRLPNHGQLVVQTPQKKEKVLGELPIGVRSP